MEKADIESYQRGDIRVAHIEAGDVSEDMKHQKPMESWVTKKGKSDAAGRTTGCSSEIPGDFEWSFSKEKSHPDYSGVKNYYGTAQEKNEIIFQEFASVQKVEIEKIYQ